MDSISRFHKQLSPAEQRAEEYGIDLSLLEDNLRLSPLERLQRHDAALRFAMKLEQAMKEQYGPAAGAR